MTSTAGTQTRDILELARRNGDFRREIVTGPRSQVVIMTIPSGEEIGEEVHDGDQILLFVEGEAEAVLNGQSSPVYADQLVYVPAGTRHNVRNAAAHPLRLITVYAPPEHPPGTVHATKAEADAAAEHH